MLDDFRIIPLGSDVEHFPFFRHKLKHGSSYYRGKFRKVRFVESFRQKIKNVGKFEYENVNMVILHRDIAPASGFETDISLATVKREMDVMKKAGIISREDGTVHGRWVVNE